MKGIVVEHIATKLIQPKISCIVLNVYSSLTQFGAAIVNTNRVAGSKKKPDIRANHFTKIVEYPPSNDNWLKIFPVFSTIFLLLFS